MGPQKMYIIKSPQLIQSTMRNKAMTFYPIMTEIADKVVGWGPVFTDLVNNLPSDGSISWMEDQHTNYVNMGPGPALFEMNKKLLNGIAGFFESVGADFETVKLYQWFREPFTKATVASLFGEKNCLTEDATLSQNLW